MWQRLQDLMNGVKETVGVDALPVPEVPPVDEAVATASEQASAAASSVTETAAGAATDVAAEATTSVDAVADGAGSVVSEATNRLSGLLDRLGG